MDSGFRLEYAEWTEETKPGEIPLLCIHGTGGSMEMWERYTFPAFWQAGFQRFLAVNMPGYGQSSRLAVHDLEGYREVLRAFLEALSIPKVHLLGISFGGSVTLSFTSKYPEQIATVTVQEPSYGNIHLPRPVYHLLRATSAAMRHLPYSIDRRMSGLLTTSPVTGFLGRKLNPVDLELLDEIGDYRKIAHEVGRKSSLRAFLENVVSGGNLTLAQEIRQIQTPVLITTGEWTHNKSLRVTQSLLDIFPEARAQLITIPKAGHLAPYTNASAFAAALSSFIGTHTL